MVNIIYPVYNLTEQQKKIHIDNWKNYSSELLKEFDIILVDDYSSPPLELDIDFPINLVIVRITEDKSYNIGGAKNLGLYLSTSEWVLQSDIDHLLLPKSASQLLELQLLSNHVYSFKRNRIKNDGSIEGRHPHANSFLIERKVFWECGGYDEDFSGDNGYGYEDALFNDNINRKYKRVLTDIYLTEYELFKTNRISRDTSRNLELLNRKRRTPNYKNGQTLRFSWEIVDRFRINV